MIMVENGGNRRVVCMYSKAYMQALAHLPVHPLRERMTVALLQAVRLTQKLQFIAPKPATQQDLEGFHSKDYIDVLRRYGSSNNNNDVYNLESKYVRLELEEFGLVDDAYVFPHLFEYCTFVAGASLTAVDALLHLMKQYSPSIPAISIVQEHADLPATDIDSTPTSSDTGTVPSPVVINLGGGRHHAMRGQASGFCYVNDVVLATQRLLSKGLSIGITSILCVDIDIHHGDGTQEAFYFTPAVTTISFHLYERGFFPGTGTAKECGVGRGKGYNVNIPLQRGITDKQYMTLFSRVIHHAVQSLKPQVIVLVCGVDTLARDSLGGFNLTSNGIGACVEIVLSFNLPVLLFGGGGYSGADACKAYTAILATIVGATASLPERVPEHEFYEKYGPDFTMATKTVLHRPNQNTPESLQATGDKAIETLDKAAAVRRTREENLLKRKR